MKPLIAVLVGLLVFIYVAEGVLINPWVFWNALPLVLAGILFWLGHSQHNAPVRRGAIGFLVAAMAVSIPAHLAWMLDLDGTRTGSSTSGLLLAVVPVYGIGLGGIAFLGTWWIAQRIEARRRDRDGHSQ
ncbi:hypothetical protein HFP89_11420 [Wenzhouxiangella sp. XN79A]|uniref:hypothetical protein n=1 Tax=Wenzhouxiangella sp. XN79A TaxID=2724193 RepID=UPI00144ABB71|nr:hypothetical protein [Wenzhouxiangella sp. XN79A]NKI35771.1 hypothetical protein [Wenzhouxiangella sp. XN79A]